MVTTGARPPPASSSHGPLSLPPPPPPCSVLMVSGVLGDLPKDVLDGDDEEDEESGGGGGGSAADFEKRLAKARRAMLESMDDEM
jgi:hypothetical protein